MQARRNAELAQPENFGHSSPKAKRESEISDEIRSALTNKLSCVVSTTQQRRESGQTIGMPDLFVTHAAWGVFCWMEVKTPEAFRRKNHGCSADQLRWHEATRAAGVPVLVVTGDKDACDQFGHLPRNMVLWAKRGRGE